MLLWVPIRNFPCSDIGKFTLTKSIYCASLVFCIQQPPSPGHSIWSSFTSFDPVNTLRDHDNLPESLGECHVNTWITFALLTIRETLRFNHKARSIPVDFGR